jgi:hypothetical protein
LLWVGAFKFKGNESLRFGGRRRLFSAPPLERDLPLLQ